MRACEHKRASERNNAQLKPVDIPKGERDPGKQAEMAVDENPPRGEREIS